MLGKLCVKNKFRYGYRKVTALLRREMTVNREAVQRIMQENHWQCREREKKRSQVGQPHIVVGNHMNRDFKVDQPLKRLVTDNTYLPFVQKLLYLSSILDLYNGEIITDTIGDRKNIELVLDTLDQLPKLSKD